MPGSLQKQVMEQFQEAETKELLNEYAVLEKDLKDTRDMMKRELKDNLPEWDDINAKLKDMTKKKTSLKNVIFERVMKGDDQRKRVKEEKEKEGERKA